MPPEPKSSPVACTLAAGDHKDRIAWIGELNAAALRDYQRVGGRIELVYEPSAAARVREFVRREHECCPFLDFTIQEDRDALILVIEAPENASEAADALFGTYTATRHSGEAHTPGH
jgi:hypothetical protein